MAWDDTKRARAIELYQEANPTAENSLEIVAEVAEELEESVNGVRLILSKAGVYIKKEEAKKAAKSSSSSSSSTGGTRVSKEAAHAQLIEAIESKEGTVDSEIISKLTGKAALYFAGVINGI